MAENQPVRYVDGEWQVLLPDRWLHCPNETDARLVATGMVLAMRAVSGEESGKELAGRLNTAAKAVRNSMGQDPFEQYLLAAARIAEGINDRASTLDGADLQIADSLNWALPVVVPWSVRRDATYA